MSLLRLLTAGRSLWGGNHSALRYRMSDPKAMPKFGSSKNPFRSTITPEAEEADALAVVGQCAEANLQPAPVLTPAPEKAEPQREAAPAPAAARKPWNLAGRLAGWGRGVRGWLPRRQPKAPKSAIPRLQKPPVQTELSLDRIKVMRNDLSDADLEIVPAGPTRPTSQQARTEVVAQPEGLPAGSAASKREQKRAGAAAKPEERASRLESVTRS